MTSFHPTLAVNALCAVVATCSIHKYNEIEPECLSLLQDRLSSLYEYERIHFERIYRK